MAVSAAALPTAPRAHTVPAASTVPLGHEASQAHGTSLQKAVLLTPLGMLPS